MKIKKILLYAGLAGLSCLGLSSCIKNDIKELGTAGTPRVRIGESPETIQYLSVFSDDKIIDLVTIRRDEVSEADVNKTVTVTIVNDPNSIESYNNDNGSSFEPFPDSLYTVVTGKGVTKSGESFTVTFEPGITAVPISISIHGSKWDLSHTYAFYFKLTDGGGKELYLDQTEALSGAAVKNKYDGKYTMTGTLTDVVVPTITAYSPWDCEFHTSGPNSVQIYEPDYATIYHAILSGTDMSVYGAFGVEITFDPATDEVVSMRNVYAPAANTRDILLDKTKTYKWNKGTLEIKYYMTQPNQVPNVAPPLYIRTTFDESYKYTGPR